MIYYSFLKLSFQNWSFWYILVILQYTEWKSRTQPLRWGFPGTYWIVNTDRENYSISYAKPTVASGFIPRTSLHLCACRMDLDVPPLECRFLFFRNWLTQTLTLDLGHRVRTKWDEGPNLTPTRFTAILPQCGFCGITQQGCIFRSRE